MPDLPTVALLFYIAAAAVGLWVLLDARVRLTHRPSWEGFVWGMGTALALPVFLPMYLLGARAPHRSGSWGPGEMIGIAVFFALSIPLVGGLLGIFEDGFTLRNVSLLILAQNAGFVLLSVFGVAVRYRQPLIRLGLTARRWGLMVGFGLAAGAAMIPVATISEDVAVRVASLVEGRPAAVARAEQEHKADPLAGVVASVSGRREVVWLVILLGLVVPIGEEIYFRGVVYGGLRRRFGLAWALIGSTLFFGVVHRQVIHFLPIALLGLVLALLYEQTESLVPAITMHAVNNIVSIFARLYGWNV